MFLSQAATMIPAHLVVPIRSALQGAPTDRTVNASLVGCIFVEQHWQLTVCLLHAVGRSAHALGKHCRLW